MVHQTAIAKGTRVVLRDHPIGVRLRGFAGTIARADDWDGYVVVQLDEPAVYLHSDGSAEDISEIVEALDNLIIALTND